MKLSKAKLMKLIKPKLEDLGFTEFRDTLSGSQGLFVKKLDNGLYLSLGLIISRYFDNVFTGAYYLSKNTRWSSVWGDIPNESYKRPGYFLTSEERSVYPEDEINVKDSYDIWWNYSEGKSISDFLRVIELTESRFVNQPKLIQKIEQSQEVKRLYEYSDKVKELVVKNQLEGPYAYLPSKEIDGIPMDWFMASEIILKYNNDILNTNTVKLLAADAFRQNQLSPCN